MPSRARIWCFITCVIKFLGQSTITINLNWRSSSILSLRHTFCSVAVNLNGHPRENCKKKKEEKNVYKIRLNLDTKLNTKAISICTLNSLSWINLTYPLWSELTYSIDSMMLRHRWKETSAHGQHGCNAFLKRGPLSRKQCHHMILRQIKLLLTKTKINIPCLSIS